jgi:hypothetical protein
VSHHNERIKGIVTRSTRDFFTTYQHFASSPVRGYDPRCLPANIIDVMNASLRQADDTFRLYTGLNKSAARKLLPRLCERLIKNPDGTFLLPSNIPPLEFGLAKYLTTILVLVPAFDGDQLFSDFSKTLKAQGVLKLSEVDSFAKVKAGVELFAISVMNNCNIQTGHGPMIALEAEGPASRCLGVAVYVPKTANPLLKMPNVIFKTDLNPKDHCEPDLLTVPLPWNMELEVKSNMRLGLVG